MMLCALVLFQTTRNLLSTNRRPPTWGLTGVSRNGRWVLWFLCGVTASRASSEQGELVSGPTPRRCQKLECPQGTQGHPSHLLREAADSLRKELAPVEQSYKELEGKVKAIQDGLGFAWRVAIDPPQKYTFEHFCLQEGCN